MKTIRNEYDKIEPLIPDKFMPFPNYNKILY
jgi:glutamine synthetase type III